MPCWQTRALAVLFTAVLPCLSLPCLGALSPAEQAALDRISADSLRGNLSFLASDALEGRATPSRGLDIAAEFIAAQFRRAGLESIAKDGSYFQTATLADALQLTLKSDGEEFTLKGQDLRTRGLTALDLTDAPVLLLPDEGELPAIEGRVVIGAARRFGNAPAMLLLQSRKPALILLVGRRGGVADSAVPVINLTSAGAADALAAKKPLTVSVHWGAPTTVAPQTGAPQTKNATARNVGAILRGSDPLLRDQYIFLTAHYDHLGMLATGSDRFYNGANDNGSGTVSVIEIANALASLPVHPKRSIVFMAWYGEEQGLLGAYYYTHHPLVPLKDTVANINLEQMGRTDEQDGAQVGTFSFTGPSYSNLPEIMGTAAKQENVGIYAKQDADAFFDRSDNYAFALAGVVAHTAVVAYEYPDYHSLADKWQKIDFPNMALVDKGVAAGLLELANAAQPPVWNESKATAPFRHPRP